MNDGKTRLYFFKRADCEACAAVEPEVRKFAAAHRDVKVVIWDLLDREWPWPKVKPPDVTPAFVCIDAAGVRTLQGYFLDADVLARWARREKVLLK